MIARGGAWAVIYATAAAPIMAANRKFRKAGAPDWLRIAIFAIVSPQTEEASRDLVCALAAMVRGAGPLLLTFVGRIFVMALRLAAPLLVTIFLVDLVLGLFARVVPQADLFSLGLPLKLLVGLGMTVVFLQEFVPIVPDLVGQMIDDLLKLVETMVPA